MKKKVAGRIGGAFDAGVSYLIGKEFCYDTLASIDYGQLHDVLLGDYPIGLKIAAASVPVVSGVGMAAFTLFGIDGLVDIYKGTHHYFGMSTLKALARDPVNKAKIEKEMQEQLKIIEEPLF
jgi:hypothetical protein